MSARAGFRSRGHFHRFCSRPHCRIPGLSSGNTRSASRFGESLNDAPRFSMAVLYRFRLTITVLQLFQARLSWISEQMAVPMLLAR